MIKCLKEKRSYYIILAIVVTNAIFTICSTTSPLYSFCDESHCFFTVGKAMLSGQILYKDILEHKGLLQYLIQIPAYFISNTTFLGVYLIQILIITLNTVLTYKMLQRLNISDKINCAIISLSGVIMFASKALASGQISEVYLMPCFTYALYTVVKLKGNEGLQTRDMFINGILLGIVVWTKYSLIAFWGVLAICNFVFHIQNKKIKKAFGTSAAFALGILVVTIPCVLYFWGNKAITSLFEVYISNNAIDYGNKISFVTTILNYVKVIAINGYYNLAFGVFCTLGMVFVMRRNDICRNAKIIIVSGTALSFLVVYIHGSLLPYYLFAFFYLIYFGAELVLKIIENKIKWKSVVAIGLACVLLSVLFKPQPDKFLGNRAELVQYKFAEHMHKECENPTLLNYDFLDGGFYTEADIVPNVWAFCRTNLNSQKMLDNQLDAIKQKKIDFVVTNSSKNNPVELYENYVLVMKEEQIRVNKKVEYCLWQVKN
ncbi:MAG: hypothetical protein IKW64_05705 [Clostridia bacterium]|nr:hypothetical protein [Clostridia bacterium]